MLLLYYHHGDREGNYSSKYGIVYNVIIMGVLSNVT